MLQSTESKRVGHDLATKQQQQKLNYIVYQKKKKKSIAFPNIKQQFSSVQSLSRDIVFTMVANTTIYLEKKLETKV